MRPCPNCNQPVADDKILCPNCGATLLPAWPHPQEGQETTAPVPREHNADQVMNGGVTGCLLSGIFYLFLGPMAFMYDMSRRPHSGYGWHPWLVFRFGTWPINLVPLAVVSGLYFLLRPRYPSFARGLGYWLVIIMILLLWGLAACRY